MHTRYIRSWKHQCLLPSGANIRARDLELWNFAKFVRFGHAYVAITRVVIHKVQKIYKKLPELEQSSENYIETFEKYSRIPVIVC